MDDISKAISTAGVSLGWRMKQVEPGKIDAVLFLRDHSAVVSIIYDTNAYSILYKDSSNLNYSGTHIHSNYNGWVKNLDQKIAAHLSTL